MIRFFKRQNSKGMDKGEALGADVTQADSADAFGADVITERLPAQQSSVPEYDVTESLPAQDSHPAVRVCPEEEECFVIEYEITFLHSDEVIS